MLLTPAKVAQQLGVCRETVYRLVAAGELSMCVNIDEISGTLSLLTNITIDGVLNLLNGAITTGTATAYRSAIARSCARSPRVSRP